MTTLLALALLLQDGSPFEPAANYQAKIAFMDGSVMWIKGSKYKLDATASRIKGILVHDGEWTISTSDRGKTYTKEPSLFAALSKLWKAAGDDAKAKVRKNLEGYAYNPFLREWFKVDGTKIKKSHGGKILDKETELIEASAGPAMKIWRIKGTHVALQYDVFGAKLTPKSIDEKADVPDDTFAFKAPDGYREDKSETEGDAERLWKELTK